MTEGTIDDKSGDGGFDVGSTADELFGAIEDDPLESSVDRSGADAGATVEDVESAIEDVEPADEDDGSGVEDQTAASVFGQLKDDLAGDDANDVGADEVLDDETPEDIIASADEPDPDPDPIDDDLLADEEELADLLLTGRTKEAEFLWIDTDDENQRNETDDAADDDTDEMDEGSDAEADVDELDAETTVDDSTAETAVDGSDDAEDVDAGSPAVDSGEAVVTETPDPSDAAAGSSTEAASTESGSSDAPSTDRPADSAADSDTSDAVGDRDGARRDEGGDHVENETDDGSALDEEPEAGPTASIITDGATSSADEPDQDARTAEEPTSEETDSAPTTDRNRGDDPDGSQPGFVRRLLSKLNPL